MIHVGEFSKLQGFQNKFAKKVLRKNVSSKEALKTLKWLPLECRRRGHRCLSVFQQLSVFSFVKLWQ